MLNFTLRDRAEGRFEKPEGMSDVLMHLLLTRGIRTREEAEAFLAPSLSALHDPMLLGGMREAVARIRKAIAARERVTVYGDYDVDGVCATAILSGYLRKTGIPCDTYLPSRHNEGYGLNEHAVRTLSSTTDLLITVDCGISSRDLVALAKECGMDVIVTDHHLPPEELPETITIDPHLGDYPFPGLCGAGVAFKLVSALGGLDAALPYIDLAAMATVADVVPLRDENRVIVKYGLDRINRSPRPGVRALADASGLTGKRVTSAGISYMMAPRLNAGGRLGSACRALDLLTETDPAKARDLAAVLDSENSARREIEHGILSDAMQMMVSFPLEQHRIIILLGRTWNAGVIGLVASRLMEKYNYPAIMLAEDEEGIATGSCRSIDGVDIYQALDSVKDILVRFGGHTKAAGLTVEIKNIPELQARLDRYIAENCDPFAFVPSAVYDMELPFTAITHDMIREMELLQPTGYGNEPPVFLAEATVMDVRAVGAEGQHLKLSLRNSSVTMPAIRFREGERAKTLQPGSERKILFVPKISDYPVSGTLDLELQAIADEDPEATCREIPRRETMIARKFLTHILYNGLSKNDSVPVIDCERVAEWLRESPQGTLIISTSEKSFRDVLPLLPASSRPDGVLGAIPTDARSFNALCYCPSAGTAEGYRRIVFADAMYGTWPEGVEQYRLRGAILPDWLRELPDLDGMRQACRALYASHVGNASTLKELIDIVCAGSDLTPTGAFAAIKVLKSMELLLFDHEDNRFRVVKGVKKDPADDAVYQTILSLTAQLGN